MKNILIAAFVCLCFTPKTNAQSEWTLDKLKQRSIDNQNPKLWDLDLLKRDIEHQSMGKDLPLTKSAFPIAGYDYYVTGNEFNITTGKYYISGISVGENIPSQNEKKIYHFSIFIVSDKATEKSNYLTESRNYPNFTAQGYYEVNKIRYNWVTAKTPDGFAMAFVNMKLFDLRFGETVFIVPNADGSFRYLQLELDPNKYGDLEQFKKAVMENAAVKKILETEK